MSSSSPISTVLLIVLFFFSFNLCFLLPVARAHSFLIYPPAYDKNFRTHVDRKCEQAYDKDGSRGICDQACPTYPTYPWRIKDMYDIEDTPVVWARGGTYPVYWARNNHDGGFIRLSLVPISKMNSKPEQRRYRLWDGCWQQGKFMCGAGKECGSDRTKMAYSGNFTVPNIIPDGVYAFSMVWYGGLTLNTQFSFWSDYHSCAFVRILGGTPLDTVNPYQPHFHPNEDSPNARPGLCKSGMDDSGQCLGRECREGFKVPATYTVPKAYQNGNMPAQLYYSDFSNTSEPPTQPTTGATPTATPSTSPSSSASTSASPSSSAASSPSSSTAPSPSTSSSVASSPSPSPSLPASASASASFSTSPSSSASSSAAPTSAPSASASYPAVPSPSYIPYPPFNIDPAARCTWDGFYCCVEACGECGTGTTNCWERPGGPNNCCVENIEKSERICGFDPAPCKVITISR